MTTRPTDRLYVTTVAALLLALSTRTADCFARDVPDIAPAANSSISLKVAGSDDRVRGIRQSQSLLVSADDVGKAFGWKVEIVRPGKLITFCRDGENGLCIPIRLNNVAHESHNDELFIAFNSLQGPLRLKLSPVNDTITRTSTTGFTAGPVSAYNSAWGEGRGFRVGQTLPDIPLMDMQGSEVRFSRFLGKQYIIYCWASW